MNTTTSVVLVTADDYLQRHWQAAAIPHPTIRAGLDWQAQDGSIVLVDATMTGLPDWHDPWWQEKTAAYRIIIADTTPNDAEAFAALQAGCFGYCQAAAPLETLRQVLEVVSEGGLWAGQGLVQRLLGAINRLSSGKPGPDLLESLSAREREVVQLASRGLVNKLIARELGITERTVKAHLSSAFEKLHIKDRVHLALLVNGIR